MAGLKCFQAEVEDSAFYARSTMELARVLKHSPATIRRLAIHVGYNIFHYDGVEYIGSEENRLAYYDDKLRGQNPFYQTY